MFIKAFSCLCNNNRKSDKSTAVKSALALCQVGEFSFAIFALASSNNIISHETASF